jgi:signal transduction histidine kinase
MPSPGASTGFGGNATSLTTDLVLNDERRLFALDATQMGTWLWDPESQSIRWDDQGRRLFGQPEGSTGTSVEDFLSLLHPDDRKATREAIDNAIEKRSDYDMIHRVVWPDGSVHWLRCKGKLEPGPQAKCILGLTIEINWLKRAEELMRTNERLATEAALANALAHEINNPLEIICNVLYLLRRSNLDAHQETLHTAATEAFQRIERITRHMLTLYSSGEQTCRFKLAGSLENAVLEHSRAARQREIIVESRCDKDLEFCGVESEVHQVVSALLSNALESVNTGGRIIVHVFASCDWSKHCRRGIRLVVADDGQGMPEDIRATLFHPFASGKKKASGLGLWTCNTIVNRYGGSIRFRTSLSPGRSGTAVSVFLRPLPDSLDSSNPKVTIFPISS